MQEMGSFDEKRSLESLFEEWEQSLQEYESSFSSERFRWLKGLSENYYVTKAAVMNGYLMGLRDGGKNVGPLVNMIQTILRVLENEDER